MIARIIRVIIEKGKAARNVTPRASRRSSRSSRIQPVDAREARRFNPLKGAGKDARSARLIARGNEIKRKKEKERCKLASVLTHYVTRFAREQDNSSS